MLYHCASLVAPCLARFVAAEAPTAPLAISMVKEGDLAEVRARRCLDHKLLHIHTEHKLEPYMFFTTPLDSGKRHKR